MIHSIPIQRLANGLRRSLVLGQHGFHGIDVPRIRFPRRSGRRGSFGLFHRPRVTYDPTAKPSASLDLEQASGTELRLTLGRIIIIRYPRLGSGHPVGRLTGPSSSSTTGQGDDLGHRSGIQLERDIGRRLECLFRGQTR